MRRWSGPGFRLYSRIRPRDTDVCPVSRLDLKRILTSSTPSTKAASHSLTVRQRSPIDLQASFIGRSLTLNPPRPLTGGVAGIFTPPGKPRSKRLLRIVRTCYESSFLLLFRKLRILNLHWSKIPVLQRDILISPSSLEVELSANNSESNSLESLLRDKTEAQWPIHLMVTRRQTIHAPLQC